MSQVALVGLGPWGQHLARNLDALGALGALYDRDPARLAEVSARYPAARCLSSWEEALQTPSLGALVLATPAGTHATLAREALLAGKDLLVEKPLALTAPEGEALAALAAARGRVLMCGLLLEFHGAALALRAAVARGELGKLLLVVARRANLGRVRAQEGALHSLAPHDVDLLLALAGGAPSQVSARGAALLRPGVEDWCAASLSFPGGLRAELFVSWLHPVKEQQLLVIGERGALVWDDTRPTQKLLLYPRGLAGVGEAIHVTGGAPVPLDYDASEPLRREVEHFLACVASRETPRTHAARAVEGLRVLDALKSCL